jgi:N6-adenosine-specific RNA methylase IME4
MASSQEFTKRFKEVSVPVKLLEYQPDLFHLANKLKDSIYFNAYKKFLFYDKPVVVKNGSKFKVLSNFHDVEALKSVHVKNMKVYLSTDIKTHEDELAFTLSRLHYKEKTYQHKHLLIKFLKEIYSVYPNFFLSLLPPHLLKEAKKSTDAKVGAILGIGKSMVNNIQRIGDFSKKLLMSLDKGELSFYTALGIAIEGHNHPINGKSKVKGKMFNDFPESGNYKVVLIDPPWDFEGVRHTGRNNVNRHYETVPLERLKELPVSKIMNDNAILFMWVPGANIADAIELMRAWRFEYRVMAFVWLKSNRTVSGYKMNFGAYTRPQAEFCLLGRNGNKHFPIYSMSVQQVISEPVTAHSVKPREAIKRIEQLCGDLPRIELFARYKEGEQPQGWDFWGNEVTVAKKKRLGKVYQLKKVA